MTNHSNSPSANYFSEIRDYNLDFYNSYIAENGFPYKHYKKSSFVVDSKIEFSKFLPIIEDIKKKYDVKNIYTGIIRGVDASNYEMETEDAFENVDPNSDYISYIYIFLNSEHAICFSYTCNGQHALELVTAYSNYDDRTRAFSEQLFEDLYSRIIQFKRNTCAKGKIGFICSGHSGLYIEEMKVRSTDLDIGEHYNDDFQEVSDKIINSLNDPDGNGIVLLHGKPGTGKTTYIRYLINNLNKSIIYVPPDMSYKVSDPSFLSFLLHYKNSILIIEDAENVIKTRESGENQAVSNLLNITDGILGDGLNFHVICTFNTGFEFIDSALTRKGRMIAQYGFSELSKEKTSKLVKKLYGENAIPPKGEMTLAEIFNMEDNNYEKKEEKRTLGFY